MKKFLFFVLFAVGIVMNTMAQTPKNKDDNSNKLAVIWSSADPEVAEKVCFMYTKNAKRQGWFDEVVLIVWGPSAKLLAEDEDLQADIKKMMEMGIEVEACMTCAHMYGIVQELNDLDLDVKPMGIPLTAYIKEGWHILSF